MCRLLPQYPDFTAVIIGPVTPDQRSFARGLQARIDAAGLAQRIRLLGELAVGEVPLWYQRISIYAFTSRIEGFGLTLLEAMSAGTAVVAARAGAAEKVIADGDTGILILPGDAEALTRALEPLMRDSAMAMAMGRRARESVVASFGIEAEAKRIAAVYQGVWSATRR
jgi:mannosyltransferase